LPEPYGMFCYLLLILQLLKPDDSVL